MFDLFLVGPSTEKITLELLSKGANILYSYSNNKKSILKYKDLFVQSKMFIDSGAFTLWTKGKEVNVDEYIQFINNLEDKVYLYGQVDSIPGNIVHGATLEEVKEAAKKTWENYLYMYPKMKYPKRLLYTFHVGEPYEYLKNALDWKDENGTPMEYIALGGMVGKPRSVRESFLKRCYKIIEESSNPNIKVHAFGMTAFNLLSEYPITSADSSSWLMTAINGGIMTKYGVVDISDRKANLSTHYSHLPKDCQDEFQNSISEFGYTLEELQKDIDARSIFNFLYMTQKAKNLKPVKIKKRSLL